MLISDKSTCLTSDELNDWCKRQNLSKQAREVIERIRLSEPSRRVGGGRNNVCGCYPSKKMGVTIQFESHKVELPFIYQLEHDENVLEFYDQPPQIKLNYQSESGRDIAFFYTPDFFVIRTDSAGWVECKTEKELKKLGQENPNRFILGSDSQWHSPPGEKYAQQFGFFFKLWSDIEIDWTLHRNLTFLEDYYRVECPLVNQSATNTILSLVSAQPGITPNQLLHHAQGVSADDINFLIASEKIYVDLTAAPLAQPENCFVFRDQQTALAYRSVALSQASNNVIASPIIEYQIGTSVCYDGKDLSVCLIGNTQVLLQTENFESVELKRSDFDNYLQSGLIKVQRAPEEGLSVEAINFLIKASETDLKNANYRYSLLEQYLRGETIEESVISRRCLQYWKAKYWSAQQKYGYGYIGLLSYNSVKGNRNRKIPEQLLKLIHKFIEEDYETYKQKPRFEVYGNFVKACLDAGTPEQDIPSYKTFIQEIKQRSGYEQILKREGRRSAYQQSPFYWELELTTPRHGERPFEIAHIDHTELDIELRHSHTGRGLGKAWVTFLVDAFSRRILAVYISFDPPSYRSCMMVLRICVSRHGRLPQSIVVDNGKEFHSTYFQTLLALFECTLKYRPPARARYGSVGERLFGTACTELVHNLAGNTQITKKVRLMTKSVNPKQLSLWPIGLLYLYLCEWAYFVYDTMDHPVLGQSPREANAYGVRQYGSRSHKIIPYDDNFKFLTLPTTLKGKAKVDPSSGVQIRYIHYWSNAFRDPVIQKTWVDVRYDPFNAGVAYAYIRGQWVECISEYYCVFKGRSEKEILLATEELHKRLKNHSKKFQLRAKHLANFLSSTEAEEVLLSQRLRDSQLEEVFAVINGGSPNRSPYSQLEELGSNHKNDNCSLPPQAERNAPVDPNQLKLFKRY